MRSLKTHRLARRAAGIDRFGAVLCCCALFLTALGGARPVRAEDAFWGVAGNRDTAVAVGRHQIFYSSTIHHRWFLATGFDTTLTYLSVVRTEPGYVVGAEDGSIWRTSNPNGSAFVSVGPIGVGAIRGLCEIGAWVVAVGDNGQILRSSDQTGSAWADQPSSVNSTLRGVASNGLSVVAVGDGGVIMRGGIQGTAWQRVTTVGETQNLYGIVARQSGGLYLAFGAGGALWRGEPDGLTWTVLASPTTLSLRGGAVNGTVTILVGDAGTVYYSPGDLTVWQPADSEAGSTLRSATFTGADFLATGDQRTILRSYTGLQWTALAVPVEQTGWGAIKYRFRRP